MRNVIFFILGIIGILFQTLGMFVIFILIALLTQAFKTMIIIGITYLLLEIWRHKYFKKQGMTVRLNTFKKL